MWKRRGKLTKFEYLKNEKSFLDEINNIFHSFWRAIIWWKNQNLIKNSRHKLKVWCFYRSFIFHIAMSQTISVINISGTCYFLHASNQWCMCWHVCMWSHASNGEHCTIHKHVVMKYWNRQSIYSNRIVSVFKHIYIIVDF